MGQITKKTFSLLALTFLALLTSSLAAVEPALLETIANGLRARQTEINVRQFNLPKEEVQAVWAEVFDAYPELFYVAKGVRYSIISGTDTVVTLRPAEYLFSEQQLAEILPRFDAMVESIYANATADNPDDLAYLLRIYDLLAYHIAYTYPKDFVPSAELPEPASNGAGEYDIVYTTAGALLYRQAVCEGYSRTLKLFLDKRGIESRILSSEAMNHAWNAVKLAGKWYHVDLTWGDNLCQGFVDYSQEPPVIYTTTEQQDYRRDFPGNVNHSFLLCTDQEFLEHPRTLHYGWTPSLEEIGTPGEEFPAAFWKREGGNSVRSLLVKDNAAYFIEHDPDTDQRILRKATWTDAGFAITDLENNLPGQWYVRILKTKFTNEDGTETIREFKYVAAGILNFDQLLVFHDAINLYGYDLVDGELFRIASPCNSSSPDFLMALWQTWDGKPLAHLTRDGNHAGKVLQLTELEELISTLKELAAKGYRMTSQHYDGATTPVLATDGTPLAFGFGSWLKTFYSITEVPENNSLTLNIPGMPDADEGALVKIELFAASDMEFAYPLASSSGPLREGLALQYHPGDYAAQQLIVRATCSGQDALATATLAATTQVLREHLTFHAFPQVHPSQWHLLPIPADVTVLEQPAERPELFSYDLQLGCWTAVDTLVAGQAYWVKGAASEVTLFCSHEPTPDQHDPGWHLVAWTDDMTEQPFLWTGSAFCLLEDCPAYGTPVLIYRPSPGDGE